MRKQRNTSFPEVTERIMEYIEKVEVSLFNDFVSRWKKLNVDIGEARCAINFNCFTPDPHSAEDLGLGSS